MSKKAKYGSREYLIEEGLPEFNQMAYYNIRMDRRSDERDIALNEGEVKTFYRATLTLLMNCIPRFKSKKMADADIKKVKEALIKIGSGIKSLVHVKTENLRELNSLKYEEQLFEFNIKLNNLMFKYGMIFPEKEVKTLKETIKDDF